MSLAATDAVWIDVLPSMKQFAPALAKGGEGAAKNTGLRMAKILGGALAGAFAAVKFTGLVKEAAGLDKMMREIITLTGETGDAAAKSLGRIKGDVKSLSDEFGIAQETLTEGLYNAVSAGVPQDNAFEFMQVAARASIAGVTDVNTAVDGLTTTINAFGLDIGEAGAVADSMFAAVQGGKTTFGELSDALFNVAPAAAAAGVSFEEVNAGIATLTAGGTPTAVATTQLRAALTGLQRPSAELDAIFQKLGHENAQVAIESEGLGFALTAVKDASGGSNGELQKLLGSVEAVAAANVIAGTGAEKFADEMERQANSAGAAGAAYDTINESAARQMEIATTRLRNMGIAVGGAVLPVLVRVLSFILDHLVPGLTRFGEAVKARVQGPLDMLRRIATRVFNEIRGAFIAFGAAWHYNDGEITSSGLPGFFERIGYIARTVFDEVRAGITAFTAAWQYNDGEVTSSGFAGVMERLGYVARQAFDWINETGLPALKSFGRYVIDDIVPAVRRFAKYLLENKEVLIALTAGVAAGLAVYKAYQAYLAIVIAVKKAWTVATKAATIAQRLFNAVLNMSPIMKIVLLVGALTAAFVYLYRNNETARAIMDKAWSAIKAAVSGVVDWFVGTAWPWMKTALSAIGDGAVMLWNNAIKPAFTGILNAGIEVFGWILNTGWPWLKTAFDAIGSVVKWLWDTIYKPYLTLIWDIAKSVFGWILNTGWPWLKSAIDSIGGAVVWLWDKMVKPYFDLIWGIAKSVFGWVKETGWPLMRDAFDSIGSKVKSVWETYISPAFDSIKSGIEAVVGAFESARSGIATVWDKVRGIVAKPIIAVIDFVNTGIIASINKILSWAGIATIPTIPIPESLRAATRGGLPSSGGTVATGPGTWVPGHADGGVLPGYSPGVDNLTFTGPAGRLELSGGEAIMRPEWTRAMGAGWVDAMNRTARTGGVSGVRRALGFARGGIMPGGKGGTLSDLVGLAGSVGESVLGILTSSNPVKWLTDRLLSGIGAIADNPLVGFMRGAVGKMATGVKDKVLGLLGWGSDPDGRTMLAPAAGVPLNWQQIRGLVGAVAPLARMSSGHRPGAITAVGTPSLHGAGRAADFVSGNMMRDFMRVVRLLPWTEAIYSPAGNAQLYRGRPHNYQGITKAMHYDHFHLGMKQGGIFNPFVADSGVTLAPGLNLVNNMLGKPEPLGRLDQPHPSHARPVERHYHAHGPSADELWRLVKARESDEMAMLRVMPV